MKRFRARRFYILTGILLMWGAKSKCQEGDYFLGNKKYSFIAYDTNMLEFPKGVDEFHEMNTIYDKLILEGEGKLNIIHIGGSHIQADIYTHVIRKRMQNSQLGLNGGRGFIFPYKIAKTNNPSNYRVSYTGTWESCKNTRSERFCDLGLSGYAVSTKDKKADIKIKLSTDSTIQYHSNQVYIYHPQSAYELTVSTADSVYRASEYNPLGYSVFNLASEIDSLHLNIQCAEDTSDQFILYGLNFKNDNPGVAYHAIGVNGSKLGSFLSCSLYEDHMTSLEPDLVVFSIGTNDAYTKKFNSEKYYADYIELIKRTKRAAPNARILLTVPNDSYLYKRYANKNTDKMRQIIYTLAKAYNCGVWDFYAVMGGFNSSQIWYSQQLMKYDRIHFNRAGYKLKGDLLFSAFLKSWEKGIALRRKTRSETNTNPVALKTE